MAKDSRIIKVEPYLIAVYIAKSADWIPCTLIDLFDSNTINKIIYFECPDPGRKSEQIDKTILDKYKIEKPKTIVIEVFKIATPTVE